MDNYKPLVSVVITCFNDQNYIQKSIASVLNQSYGNVEVIVVDDCSEDGTVQLIRRHFPGVSLLVNSKNLGVSASRNIGYRSSRGNFVTQLDSDDMFHPEKIEKEVCAALEFPGAIVSSRTTICEESADLPSSIPKSKSMRKRWIQINTVKYRLGEFGRDWLIPAALIKEVEYDPRHSLYEDWKFKLDLIQRAPVVLLDSPGTFYRKTHGGLSKKTPRQHRISLYMIFRELYPKEKPQAFLFWILITVRSMKSRVRRLLEIN